MSDTNRRPNPKPIVKAVMEKVSSRTDLEFVLGIAGMIDALEDQYRTVLHDSGRRCRKQLTRHFHSMRAVVDEEIKAVKQAYDNDDEERALSPAARAALAKLILKRLDYIGSYVDAALLTAGLDKRSTR